MNWFYKCQLGERGPIPSSELKRLAASGQLLLTDAVRREDMESWIVADDVPGLFPVSLPTQSTSRKAAASDGMSRPVAITGLIAAGICAIAIILTVVFIFRDGGSDLKKQDESVAALPPTPTPALTSSQDNDDADTAKKVALAFVKAMTAKDMTTAHQLATGTDAQFESIQVLNDFLLAYKRLSAVVEAKYGEKLPGEMPPLAEYLGTCSVKIEGDTAILADPNDKYKIASLRKYHGNWRGDLPSAMSKSALDDLSEKTKHYSALTNDIESGAYKTSIDFHNALSLATKLPPAASHDAPVPSKASADLAVTQKYLAESPNLMAARAAAQAGQHSLAIQKLKEECNRIPNSAVPWLLLAAENFQIGHYSEAFSEYNNAIALEPGNSSPYLERGWAYFCCSKFDQAIDDFGKAIQLSPDDAKGYSGRAEVYTAQRNFEKVIEDFSQVIRIQPNDADAYLRRAQAYTNQKQYEKAIADLDQGLKLKPDDVLVHLDRARLLSQENQFDKALLDYDQAIKARPNDPVVYFARGKAFLDQTKLPARAIEDLERAVALKSDFASAYLKLGDAYLADKQDAKAALSTGRGCLYSGRYDEALKNFLRVVALQPDLPAGHYECGRAYAGQALQGGTVHNARDDTWILPSRNQSLAREAVKCFERAIKLDPNDAQSYFEEGKIHFYMDKNGGHDWAVPAFGNSIRLQPNFFEAYLWRGMYKFPGSHDYYVDQEASQKAIEDLNTAIQLNSKDGRPYYWRARANVMLGNKDSALKDFDKAVALLTVDVHCEELSAINYVSKFSLDNASLQLVPYSYKAAALVERGLFTKDSGKHDAAINDLDEAIRILPNRSQLFWVRGVIYDSNGSKKEALADYRHCARLEPGDEHYKDLLSQYDPKISSDETVGVIAGAIIGLVALHQLNSKLDRENLIAGLADDEVLCDRCNGTGRMDCPWCKEGLIYHNDAGPTRCFACLGDGWLKCTKCNGYRKLKVVAPH